MTARNIMLIVSTTLFASLAFGQDYLSNDRQELINEFKSNSDNYKTSIDTSYKISFVDTINSFKIEINGYEKIEMEFFFDLFDNLCDSVIMRFSCSECLDKHVSDFLATKKRKWKKIMVDYYISRKRMSTFTNGLTGIKTIGSPQMVIKRTPGQPFCATIYFSIPMMDTDKWKQLTKK